MTAARRRLGQAGEARAERWYRDRGYEVLDRNWRVREGELDLVLRTGRTLVFCEVKTRSSDAYGTAAEAVTPVKQARIRRLAVAWLQAQRVRAHHLRFDVAAVTPRGVEVIEGAF